MTSEANAQAEPDPAAMHFRDMLLRVREVDPAADAEAVRRFAHEIAAAGDVLQSLNLDPSLAPLDVAFSPDWKEGRAP